MVVVAGAVFGSWVAAGSTGALKAGFGAATAGGVLEPETAPGIAGGGAGAAAVSETSVVLAGDGAGEAFASPIAGAAGSVAASALRASGGCAFVPALPVGAVSLTL
jgi:hypothetical protein